MAPRWRRGSPTSRAEITARDRLPTPTSVYSRRGRHTVAGARGKVGRARSPAVAQPQLGGWRARADAAAAASRRAARACRDAVGEGGVAGGQGDGIPQGERQRGDFRAKGVEFDGVGLEPVLDARRPPQRQPLAHAVGLLLLPPPPLLARVFLHPLFSSTHPPPN